MKTTFNHHLNQLKVKSLGFTLIELLVASSLSILFVIVVSTMFFVTTINSTKIEAKRKIKNTGNEVKNTLDFLIKNSLRLMPNDTGQTCSQTPSDSLKLKNLDGGITTLKLVTSADNSFIASNSTLLNPKNITAENLQFDCIRNQGGESYVHYQFDLRLGQVANQHFSSFVLLRNY